MARLAISELTTYRWSFEEDVTQYVAAGIDSLGVWRHKLSDYGEERGGELIAEHRLAVSSLSWAGGFSGSDGRSHEESVEDACDAIRLAAVLRAGCLILHSGPRALHTQKHVRRLLTTALDTLLPLAEQLKVTLALEPMPPETAGDWTFLTTLTDATELIVRTGSPALKLVLDTCHWGRSPALQSELESLIPHLALVQLADSRGVQGREPNRCRLGEGTIPLERVVATLVQAGYRGEYEVELMGEDLEACDYSQLLSHSQRTFDSLLAAAAKAAPRLPPLPTAQRA